MKIMTEQDIKGHFSRVVHGKWITSPGQKFSNDSMEKSEPGKNYISMTMTIEG